MNSNSADIKDSNDLPYPDDQRVLFGIEQREFDVLDSPIQMLLQPFLVTNVEEILRRKYRLESLAGRGKFGFVFRALDRDKNEPVAVKFLDPFQLEVFRADREIRHLANINHDNVVRYFAHGNSCGRVYLVTEWIDGTSLEEWVRSRGNRLSSLEVSRIGIEIGSGLVEIHGQPDKPDEQVRHRDIKAANIMVCGGHDKGVKIIDLGLAKSEEDDTLGRTSPEARVGTPNHSPHEYLRFKADTHLWDLFSTGCVLYRLVAGELPFSDWLDIYAPNPPKSLSQTCPECDGQLAAVIMKLLSHNPIDRYQNANLVVEELKSIRQRLILANPISIFTSNVLSMDFGADELSQSLGTVAGLTLRVSQLEECLNVVQEQSVFVTRFAWRIRDLLHQLRSRITLDFREELVQIGNVLARQYRDFQATVHVFQFSHESTICPEISRIQNYVSFIRKRWFPATIQLLRPSPDVEIASRIELIVGNLTRTLERFESVRHLIQELQLADRKLLMETLAKIRSQPLLNAYRDLDNADSTDIFDPDTPDNQ